jgi:hypothetical protein
MASTRSISGTRPFFTASSDGFTYSLSSSPSSPRRLSTADQIGIVIGVTSLLLLTLGIYIWLRWRRASETFLEDVHLQRDAFQIGIAARNNRFASRAAGNESPRHEGASRPASISDAALRTDMSYITRPTRTTRPTQRSEIGSEHALTASEPSVPSQLV